MTEIKNSSLIAAIPEKYLRPNTAKAIITLCIAFASYALSLLFAYFVRAHAVYWLYPVSYIAGSIAVTGLFVVAHDCGHFSFLRNKTLMNVIGNVFMIPSLYPFYAWRYSHNAHHSHTNNLKGGKIPQDHSNVYCDNAWIPWTVKQYEHAKKHHPLMAFGYRFYRLLLPIGSVLHQLFFHFYPPLFNKNHRKKVAFSVALVVISTILICTLIYQLTNSVYALFHFFFIPAFLMHIWLSTYTYLHHTYEESCVYHNDEQWDPAKAALHGTANIYFPRWISFFHFNIDVHVPHHVSVKVPCYYLRQVTDCLKQAGYDQHITERRCSLAYLYKQTMRCKLWDEEKERYVDFDGKEG